MYRKLWSMPLLFALFSVYFNESFRNYIFQALGISSSESSETPTVRLLTANELKLYNGIDKPELYLAILGRVYDVSKGSQHYGPGQSYNFFVGKDASRSFVTGKFGEGDASEDVIDFTPQELRSLNHWVKFYNTDYVKIGKLIGKYFNDVGKLTPYGKQVKKMIKVAEQTKVTEDLAKLDFPPCNMEWDQDRGTHVWCTDRSGGVKRSWVGVPRQLYETGSGEFRCTCVNEENLQLGNLKEFDGCDSTASSCYVKG